MARPARPAGSVPSHEDIPCSARSGASSSRPAAVSAGGWFRSANATPHTSEALAAAISNDRTSSIESAIGPRALVLMLNSALRDRVSLPDRCVHRSEGAAVGEDFGLDRFSRFGNCCGNRQGVCGGLKARPSRLSTSGTDRAEGRDAVQGKSGGCYDDVESIPTARRCVVAKRADVDDHPI